MIKFNNSWDQLLKDEFNKPYFINLLNFLEKEYQEKTIFPKQEDLFNAFKYTKKGKVILKITGDITEDEAVLQFSVKDTGIGIKKSNSPLFRYSFLASRPF